MQGNHNYEKVRGGPREKRSKREKAPDFVNEFYPQPWLTTELHTHGTELKRYS